MNKTIVLIGVLILAALAAPAQSGGLAPGDVRVVQGKSVDLGPLHQWLRHPVGERPLQHWQRFRVVEKKAKMSVWDTCVLSAEDGKLVEVLVANLPPAVTRHLQAVESQQARLAALQARIASDEADWRRQDAVTPTGASGSQEYVDETLAARARVNLNAVALREKKELLASLLAEHKALTSRDGEYLTIFAMFTGRNFASLPVWDCGLTK